MRRSRKRRSAPSRVRARARAVVGRSKCNRKLLLAVGRVLRAVRDDGGGFVRGAVGEVVGTGAVGELVSGASEGRGDAVFARLWIEAAVGGVMAGHGMPQIVGAVRRCGLVGLL